MGAQVVLQFADGEARTIPVAPGVPILDAALDAGVPLVHQCRSGSCGTCVARLVAGHAIAIPGRAQSLLASEVAAGYRLTCSSLAVSDTTWSFDYAYPAGEGAAPPSYAARVDSVRRVARSVLELTLSVATQSGFAFTPGQYVRIAVPGADAERSVSMASPPHELPRMRFLLRHLPGGVLSEYLASRCKPGDALTLSGPLGAFALPAMARSLVLVAGGTGLAPMLSMLDAARHAGRARMAMRLCFGAGAPAELFYLDELELRAFWLPALKVDLAVDSDGEGRPANARIGSVVDLLTGVTVPSDATILLCGPPAMIAAARARVESLGIPAERVLSERFNPT